MIEQVETGKLYKSVWGAIYECVGVTPEVIRFLRITQDYTWVSAEYNIFPSEAIHEIEREATVQDIEEAMDDCRDAIESLRNEIDGYKGSMRDLDEWRDRLEA